MPILPVWFDDPLDDYSPIGQWFDEQFDAAAGPTVYPLDVTVGTFTFAGTTTGLLKANRIDSSVGTFILAGTTTGLLEASRIDTSVGTFALAGTTTGLLPSVQLDISTGTFTVVGNNSILETILGSFNLTTGTYNVSGNNVGVNRFYQLNSQPGTYQVVGSGLDYFSNRNLVTLPLDIVTDFRSVGNFFWYQTTQTIQPVKYRITKRNEFILGRQTHMGRRGL